MTTDTGRLLERAERCEAATGPDRELDALIYIAATYPTWRLQTDCEPFPDAVQPGRIQEDGSFGWREAPKFTASLDAAMSLVLEGHEFGVGNSGNPDGGGIWAWCEKETKGIDFPYARGATLALALCAAALRARAASATGEGL